MAIVSGTNADNRGAGALSGTGAADIINGLGGQDELFGLGGADILQGGEGDDILEGGAGGDTLVGGQGVDTASYKTALGAVRVELLKTYNNRGDASGDAYSSVENLIGSDFADTLVGDHGSNRLEGGAGADNLQGQGGTDWLLGGEGDDALQGNGGNDRLEGGAGNDSLSGGSGQKDYFIFKGQWDIDVIADYEAGVDEIDFRDGGPREGAYSLTQIGNDTLITAAGGSVLVLNAAPAALIIRADPPPVSQAVLDFMLSAISIAENSVVGTVVGTLSTTTTGQNTSFSYALLDDAQGRFKLEGNKLVATGQGLNFEASATHNVTIKVTDGDGVTSVETLTISLSDRNEAPSAITLANQVALAENTTTETKIADLAVVDPDTALAFQDNSVTVDDSRFVVKNGALFVKAGQAIDFEAAGSIPLILTATSSAGAVSKSVSVSVLDRNDAPTALLVTNQVSLGSSNSQEVRVADLAVVDPDTALAFRDNVVSVDDARFVVKNGALYFKAGQSIDTAAGPINLSLTVNSSAGTLTKPLSIAVQDVNDAPTDLVVTNQAVLAENTTTETRLADLAVVDPDTQAGFLDNVVTVNDARFVVKNGSLYLKAGQSVNFEAGASIPLQLTVTSSAGALVKSISLNITDVNEAPTAINLANQVSLAENTSTETKLADLTVLDPDTASAFRDSVVLVDDARFVVKAGGLYLKAGQSINFEAASAIPLVLTATSAAGTISRSVSLAVGNINEAPTAILIANQATVLENTSVETKLADLSVADPDTVSAFLDNSVTVDDARFTVKNGGLYLKAGQVIDYEAGSSIGLVLTATSSAGTITKALELSVGDVAEGGSGPAIYVLNRAGTSTPLVVDLAKASQTLADGTVLTNVERIDFTGGEGGDNVLGGAYGDVLRGNGGGDSLDGRGGDDLIVGGAGDSLRGGAGADVLEITGAPALIDGGDDFDRLKVTASTTFAADSISNIEAVDVARGVSANFSNISNQGLTISAAAAGATGVVITGTRANDVITGSSLADTIDGSNGNDILRGGGGNDRLTSGPGYDELYGEEGDDVLESKRGTGPDAFDGGSGTDRVVTDLAKVAIDLTLDLSNPAVRQFLGDGTSLINVEAVQITGGTGNDSFTGGALADSLGGYDGDDVLRGGGGNDTLNGGAGYDVAVYQGHSSSYSIALQADGTYKISGGAEGTDTLTDIEAVRFSDGERPIDASSASAAYWGSTAGTATLIASTPVPDGRGANPGTGFTITGLTRAGDGTWWAANEGQADAYDNTYTPSIVHLAADLATKIGEIILPSAVRSVQGVAYKAETDEIFVGSLSERLVRVYSSDGTFLRSFAPTSGTSVNGLAYDPALDAVIIGHESGNAAIRTVEWRSATTGAFIKSMDLLEAPDQLYVDSADGAQGALYYTFGDSGVGRIGYVAKVDIATGIELGRYALPDADAVEGVVLVDKAMFIANDGYYHEGDPALNQILEYDITPIAYELDVRGSTAALSIDLAQDDQTLADGHRLVGVERLFYHGGTGNDQVTGGAYNDVLVGGGGSDGLRGAGGEDRLLGLSGDDFLVGGSGADSLDGGTGLDRLEGGLGNDLLTGGSGQADTFVYGAGDWGSDRISDFESGLDVLDFRGSGVSRANLSIAQQASGVTITVAGHGVIVLDGVNLSGLDTSNWLF